MASDHAKGEFEIVHGRLGIRHEPCQVLVNMAKLLVYNELSLLVRWVTDPVVFAAGIGLFASGHKESLIP